MLTYERHEEILNLLNNPTTDQATKTDLFGELRQGFGEGTDTITTLTENNEKLSSSNTDLTLANSKLFRQIGVPQDEETKEKEEEKTFSETVTLEQLEKGL